MAVDQDKGSINISAEKSPIAIDEKLRDLAGEDEIDFGDVLYQKKARLLNAAMQETGMGRYQWELFVVAGFGYIADYVWPIVIGLALPQVMLEFQFEGPFLSLGFSIGALVGAGFWGIGADLWGRRLSFNCTLFLQGAFALAAGGSPNWVTLTSLLAVLGVGVGGNFPVDSAIFLEFVPHTHQNLLTGLTVWWAFGQLISSLIAWPLIGNFSCVAGGSCPRSSNQGWRYFFFVMGGFLLVLWAIRFFAFTLYESPKYLMGKGKDAEAVVVIHKIAERNKVQSSLTVESLRGLGEYGVKSEDEYEGKYTTLNTVRRTLKDFDSNHLHPLFATRKMTLSTTLLAIIWALIGLAFPLYMNFIPYYLATRGADFGDGSIYITYRNQVILSVMGIPGALLASYLVDLPILGRKGTAALSTVSTGIFVLIGTTARSSNALLGWNCAYGFTSSIMYASVSGMTPELFPTKARGTGNALIWVINRISGVLAPIVALYGNLTSSVPIFVSGAFFIAGGLFCLLLPYEPRGKASL